MPRSPSFCSFASFFIVLLTTFIYKPDSSKDWFIFMISVISLFEIINIVMRNPKVFFWIAAFVADVAAVNHNGNKLLLANAFSTFFIKGKPVFTNSPKSLPISPLNCPILRNWVFDNFTSADEPFAKVLQISETYV